MNPKLNDVHLTARTTRLLAQVAVCSLALGMLLGVGINPASLPEGAASTADGPAWTVEHAAIDGTPEPAPATF